VACPACDSSERTRIAPGFFRCDANLQHLSNGPDGVEVWYSKCGREYQDSDPGMAGGTGVLCNCGCGLYAVGECTRCGQGFSGEHRGQIGGAFVCLGCFEQHCEQVAQHDRNARGTAQRGQSLEEAARARRDAEALKAQDEQRERESRQRVEDEFRAKSRAYKDSLVAWAAQLATRLEAVGATPERRMVHRAERQETTYGIFRTKTRTVSEPPEYASGWILEESSWSKTVYVNEDNDHTVDQGRKGTLLTQSGELLSYRVSTHRARGPVREREPSQELLRGEWSPVSFRERDPTQFTHRADIELGNFSCVWEGPMRLVELETALSDLAIRLDLL
jgi:hypothetical protein